MIAKLLKNRNIKKLQSELILAKKNGHVVFITDVTDMKVIGGNEDLIGVEIMFDDAVTDKQISKLVKYIEEKYKFGVLTELCERGTTPKILIVEY